MAIKVSDKNEGNNKFTSQVEDLETASSHNTYKAQVKDDTSKDGIFKGPPTIENKYDGHYLPTVLEIHQSDHHQRNWTSKSTIKYVMAGFGATIMMLSLLYILTTPAVSNRPSSFPPESSFGQEGTYPLFTANYNRTIEYLVQNNISTLISLLTEGTPQFYATSYIADQLQLVVPDDDDDNIITTSTHDGELLRQQQTYRYIARYVLALDYFYFTKYTGGVHGLHDDNSDQHSQEDQEIVEPVPFLNFITSGMDICQWNYRSSPGDDDTDVVVQMGVICSIATKLPVNLTISGMNLDGTIPTENGLLTSLQILNLEKNNLFGTIPTELFQLTKLQHLNLGDNVLTGSIPSEIGELLNLETLILSNNVGVSGSIPATITQLSSLQAIDLVGTSVSFHVN